MSQAIFEELLKAEWEVELAISGPISVEKTWTRNVQKGDEFWTPITIRNTEDGVALTIIARAIDRQNANDAAVYFVGKALDVLSLRLNLPLHLSLFEPKFKKIAGHIKRRVKKEEWLHAFRRGREYDRKRRYFSRSLGWYRKGLNSEDPIDRLLAFWSALEGISSQYFRHSERTKEGIINQICDCFDQLWGNVDNWKVIPGNAKVVNEFYAFRNGIAHGALNLDVDTIRKISSTLELYQSLVYRFLVDWEHTGYTIERQHSVQSVDQKPKDEKMNNDNLSAISPS